MTKKLGSTLLKIIIISSISFIFIKNVNSTDNEDIFYANESGGIIEIQNSAGKAINIRQIDIKVISDSPNPFTVNIKNGEIILASKSSDMSSSGGIMKFSDIQYKINGNSSGKLEITGKDFVGMMQLKNIIADNLETGEDVKFILGKQPIVRINGVGSGSISSIYSNDDNYKYYDLGNFEFSVKKGEGVEIDKMSFNKEGSINSDNIYDLKLYNDNILIDNLTTTGSLFIFNRSLSRIQLTEGKTTLSIRGRIKNITDNASISFILNGDIKIEDKTTGEYIKIDNMNLPISGGNYIFKNNTKELESSLVISKVSNNGANTVIDDKNLNNYFELGRVSFFADSSEDISVTSISMYKDGAIIDAIKLSNIGLYDSKSNIKINDFYNNGGYYSYDHFTIKKGEKKVLIIKGKIEKITSNASITFRINKDGIQAKNLVTNENIKIQPNSQLLLGDYNFTIKEKNKIKKYISETPIPYNEASPTKVQNEPKAGFEEEIIESSQVSHFSDKNITSLEGQAASYLYDIGIVGGYSDGTFKGDKIVNRAEVVKFLILSKFGKDFSTSYYTGNLQFKTFCTDVKQNEWYAKFINKADFNNIMNGYPDKTCRPGQGVRRGEFLKMMAKTFGLGKNLSHNFQNIKGIWVDEYAGIVGKYDLFPNIGNKLDYEKFMTRDEVVVAIYNYLKKQ